MDSCGCLGIFAGTCSLILSIYWLWWYGDRRLADLGGAHEQWPG
jgi:hypothetical protein